MCSKGCGNVCAVVCVWQGLLFKNTVHVVWSETQREHDPSLFAVRRYGHPWVHVASTT